MVGKVFKGALLVSACEVGGGEAVRRQDWIVIVDNGGDMQILVRVDTTDNVHRGT
jgi:hypothetical protein